MRGTMNRQVIGWALYDWGNSAFATVVLAGFFPIFFRDFWGAGRAGTEITFALGAANSIASIAIVLLAPVLGSIADSAGLKKRLLLLFAALGITMTAALFWVAEGELLAAAVVFVLGNIGFLGANVFYDALIVGVTDERHYDRVSALGYALGYLGGGLLFAFCVAMTLMPGTFGLEGPAEAVRLCFLLTALWWAAFTVPILLFVREPRPASGPSGLTAVRAGLRQLVGTFHEMRRLRVVGLFLLAYWLYIDGVDTIIRMAVDYGKSLGFGTEALISALLITQFVGFPAAIVFGHLGTRWGTKRALLLGIGVYVLITVWGSRMTALWEFYGLAITVGLVQGGVQSLSRSLYARLIPPDKAGEFFGFYNMLGKFAAVLGPVLMGWVGYLADDPRVGILSLLLLFLPGAVILYLVDEREGHRMAETLSDRPAQNPSRERPS